MAPVIAAYATWLIPLILIVLIGFKLYEHFYYKGEAFLALKERADKHVRDCNELNEHLEELRNTKIGFDKSQYGHADYHDNSSWNFQRKEYAKISNASNVHNCSRTVCDNSRKEPMKYVCKYFNFKADNETLSQFEDMLNNFSAAEEGRSSLLAEKKDLLNGLYEEIPYLIKTFSKERFEKELGFEDIDLSDTHYPKFIFRYVSSGGNASTENVITMDISNLNAMVNYLDSRIKWSKSVAGQRALMTSSLRRSILERDGHTCKQCGASLSTEPHLLLEVDHIVPVSKGGLTRADNLQTLCWRCNRSKGAKLISEPAAE